jgi:LysM repeat protein
VTAGDTLSAIARRFDLDIDALRALNGIGDADSILVGQTLRLAPESAPVDTAAPTPQQTATDAAPTDTPDAATVIPTVELPIERSGNPIGSLNRTYQIRTGDTLNLIALRTGVDAESLRRLNGFASLNAALNAGQQLILPATGDELRPRTPAREYEVKPGETLSRIAADYGVTLGAILQANRIADPNAVYPGQRLLIPTAAETAASTGLQLQIGPARSGYFYYTVQPGDTMSEIARNLNTTMLAIQTYNNLPDVATVYNGMELKIPYGPPPLNRTLPPAPTSGTRFVVSLSRQQCWVYQGDRILHSWPCSTGAGERRTKPGNYAVQSKILNAKSNVWQLDMPYWLGIYDVGPYENGIHGLPVAWKTGKKIWSG